MASSLDCTSTNFMCDIDWMPCCLLFAIMTTRPKRCHHLLAPRLMFASDLVCLIRFDSTSVYKMRYKGYSFLKVSADFTTIDEIRTSCE